MSTKSFSSLMGYMFGNGSSSRNINSAEDHDNNNSQSQVEIQQLTLHEQQQQFLVDDDLHNHSDVEDTYVEQPKSRSYSSMFQSFQNGFTVDSNSVQSLDPMIRSNLIDHVSSTLFDHENNEKEVKILLKETYAKLDEIQYKENFIKLRVDKYTDLFSRMDSRTTNEALEAKKQGLITSLNSIKNVHKEMLYNIDQLEKQVITLENKIIQIEKMKNECSEFIKVASAINDPTTTDSHEDNSNKIINNSENFNSNDTSANKDADTAGAEVGGNTDDHITDALATNTTTITSASVDADDNNNKEDDGSEASDKEEVENLRDEAESARPIDLVDVERGRTLYPTSE